jgi:hypothetical protein
MAVAGKEKVAPVSGTVTEKHCPILTFCYGAETNKTNYQCKTIECACVADRFLCGEDGSVSE